MRRLAPGLLVILLAAWAGAVVPARAAERWAKVESTYFTLYAECSASDTRDWAVCFEQFRSCIQEVIRVPPAQLQPLTMVVFRNRDSIVRYLPRRNGKEPTDLGSVTMTLPTGTIILTSLNWDDRKTRQSLYEAGTYWFLGGFKHRGPDWLLAGLAGTFKTFTVTDDEIQLGEILNEDLVTLRENHLVPLSQLFATEMSQLDYRADTRTAMFYAQSWLFVHYLIYGRDARAGGKTHGSQLSEFVGALEYGVPAESAFRQAFGTDYDGMNRQLETYLLAGRHAIYSGKFDRTKAAKDLKATLEPAGAAELARGYACLAGNRRDEARAHFITAQTMPGGELTAAEVLGDMAMFDQNTSEAAVQYGRALDLGSRNYRAAYFFGEELVRGQLGHAAELPRFEAKQARRAASRFEQAINLYPDYVPSYERLALLMPSLVLFSEADRQFLELGLRVSPGNELLEAGLGVWELKNHQTEKGRQRLRALLTPDRRTSGWARLIAEGQAAEQATDTGMAAVRQLMAAGKFDEAGDEVGKLLRQATTQPQRAALAALRGEIGLFDLVSQAEKLADDKQWDAAGAIAQSALDGHPPPDLKQRAEAVLARAAKK